MPFRHTPKRVHYECKGYSPSASVGAVWGCRPAQGGTTRTGFFMRMLDDAPARRSGCSVDRVRQPPPMWAHLFWVTRHTWP